jgi:hypothetical protein
VVDDLEGLGDERVVGPADAVADQLEEAAVDDLAGVELGLLLRASVGDADVTWLDRRIVERFAGSRRTDSHVVALDAWQQDSVVRRGPLIEVRFEPVGVRFQEVGKLVRLIGAGDVRGAEQAGDDRGEGGRRIARVLLPAFLLGDRGITDEEGGCMLDEWEDVEVAEAVELPQAPGKDDRKRNLVQLDARPVGGSVDPEILREAAIRPQAR